MAHTGIRYGRRKLATVPTNVAAAAGIRTDEHGRHQLATMPTNVAAAAGISTDAHAAVDNGPACAATGH